MSKELQLTKISVFSQIENNFYNEQINGLINLSSPGPLYFEDLEKTLESGNKIFDLQITAFADNTTDLRKVQRVKQWDSNAPALDKTQLKKEIAEKVEESKLNLVTYFKNTDFTSEVDINALKKNLFNCAILAGYHTYSEEQVIRNDDYSFYDWMKDYGKQSYNMIVSNTISLLQDFKNSFKTQKYFDELYSGDFLDSIFFLFPNWSGTDIIKEYLEEPWVRFGYEYSQSFWLNSILKKQLGFERLNNKFTLEYISSYCSDITDAYITLLRSSSISNIPEEFYNNIPDTDLSKDPLYKNYFEQLEQGIAQPQYIALLSAKYILKDFCCKSIEKFITTELKDIKDLLFWDILNNYDIAIETLIYSGEDMPADLEAIPQVNDEVVDQRKDDIRKGARTRRTNSYSISDYFWLPEYGNLSLSKINPEDFPYLKIYEFQPDAAVPRKYFLEAGAAVATDLAKGIGKVVGEKLANSNPLNAGDIERFGGSKNKFFNLAKKFLNTDSAKAIGTVGGYFGGRALVNTELYDPDNKTPLSIDWVKDILPGKWVGYYEIPFLRNSFIQSKSRSAWKMGNALGGENGSNNSTLTAIQDMGQLNVQEIPTWSFNNAETSAGIDWEVSFFLINDTIYNIKRNLNFLLSFAAGSFWVQITEGMQKAAGFGGMYHCPNLYRIECPGRFIQLFSALDVSIEYYGKITKYSPSDAQEIFNSTKWVGAYTGNRQCFIPAAYKIDISSKSLQPNCFNIQYGYLNTGPGILGITRGETESGNARIGKKPLTSIDEVEERFDNLINDLKKKSDEEKPIESRNVKKE
jgi:hypothetical protein